MTTEEVLDRLEKAINDNYYSQIWNQNLQEEIDKIRGEIAEQARMERVNDL